MKLLYPFSVKHLYRVLSLFLILLTTRNNASAQCDQEIFFTQSPWVICSSQTVTLTVETYYSGQNGIQSGVLKFYHEETGGQPFVTKEVNGGYYDIYTDVEIMADYNGTVWVSYYNNWTACESPRHQYDYYCAPTPTITSGYSYACGNTATVKMNSSSAAYWYLYKLNNAGNWDLLQSNTTGSFTIANYDPNGTYSLYLASSEGCSNNLYTTLSFETFGTSPLTVSGNLSITTGSSTTLSATGPDFYTSIKWFDAAGNLLSESDPFTTPVLTTSTTYQVRGYNDNNGAGETCVTDPASVTVQVTTPVVCNRDITISQPYMCSPQYITLTAEMENDYQGQGSYMSGTMKWYNQATGGQVIASKEIYSNAATVTGSAEMYADWNTTVWISYYDNRTGCESPRVAYTFNFSPTPTLSWDYANACGGLAKIQLTSTLSDVTFYMYKANSSGAKDVLQHNTTGYFEIADYDVNGLYYAQAVPASGCGSSIPTIDFEVYSAAPPTVIGNTTISSGSSTTLKAYSNDVYNFKWYDASGNILYDGADYTTPVLTGNIYTYQVYAISNDGYCVSEPTTVTVTVDLPSTTYSTPYTSSTFTKTIDLSKPVGAINGTPGTTAAGAATYTIPIYTPPGTNSVVPSVGIAYSSQSGNGIAGYGWSIAGLSAIGRNGKSIFHNGEVAPVTYTDQDAFILDGVRLNPISGDNGANGTIYASEAEGFSKIISNGSTSANPDWFQVVTKDGTTMEYGRSTDSRLLTDDGTNVTLWRLNKIIDLNGNYVEFKYDNGYRDSRIDEINYTGNANSSLQPYNKIKFNYEVRSDVATAWVAGASFVSKYILKSIAITSEGNAVKTYGFNYEYDNLYSLLQEVTETGSDGTSLNSTTFLYGDHTQSIQVSSTSITLGAYDFYAGDFDADGKTDLLAASMHYEDGIRYHTRYDLLKDFSASSATEMYFKELTDGDNIVSGDSKKYNNFLTSDYDGDGRDDVLQLTTTYSDSKRTLQNIIINYTKSFNSSTSYTDHIETSYAIPAQGSTYNFISDKNIYFIPGDFDGDGNQDYIVILGRAKNSSDPSYNDDYLYKAFMNSPSTGALNLEITNFGVGSNSVPAFYTNTIANADIVMPIDFDGDGKQEILVATASGDYVLSFQKNGSTCNATLLLTSEDIFTNYLVYRGDFNGDSKTDLLIRDPVYKNWEILYSTGTSFKSSWFTFNRTPSVTGATDDDKIVISDFNDDGKSDILHGYKTTSAGITTSKFGLYNSMGSSAPSFQYEQYDYSNTLATSDGDGFVVGDFDGDGRSDLLNRINNYADADFIRFNSFSKERMLTKVADGHNVTHSFDYKLLSTDEETDPGFYTRTISLDDPANGSYFNYIQLPYYVVSSFTGPNGIGGVHTTNFSYEDAVIHKTGKGFLGFKKIIANDLTLGLTSTTENAINTDFAVPYTSRETVELTATRELLSESTITTSFISLSTGANDPKRFFQQADKTLSVNYLKGSAVESVNTYGSYGNVDVNVKKTGTPSGSTVNAVETVTTATTYIASNTPVASLPEQVTVTRSRNGAGSLTDVTRYTYNAGVMTTQTSFFGLPKALTTTFGHDAFGNVTSTNTTATGVAPRATNTTYDSKGRFAITKETAAGTPIAQTETFIFDGRWGTPLSSTTTDCFTSTFEYDAFGRQKKATGPVFTANFSMGWDVTGNKLYYCLTDYTGGKPDTKEWFDMLDREVSKQAAGFNNQWLTAHTTYDVRGNETTTTNTYYSNETPIVTTRLFDAYNRPQTMSNGLSSVQYTYSLTGGNLQATTTDQDGHASSKTTDAAGRVIASNDKGGDLYFSYDARGLQTELKHGGAVVLTSTYDDYGRKTSQVDKNAGTITYVYDPFSQLITETDNSNHTYQLAYDELGRMISRQGPEGTTTYEYYKNNTTGCSNNNLKKSTGFNSVIKEYAYDNLMRITTETATIDGVPYVTTYGYDTYSNVNKITYPSGVEVNKVYDNNGNLTQVTGGSPGAQTTLFNATAKNGFGMYTAYTLSNNRTSQLTFENGFPKHYYTQNIQDLNFNWDYANKNLTSRQDYLKGVTENFQYDALNRLTQSAVNGQTPMDITYDGSPTFSMGNIATKADAGNYTYKNDKIHAVAYITNPTAISNSTIGQVITYTPFLKTETISENDYQIAFTYGPEYQRVKSVLQYQNAVTETKIFAGDYEKFTDNTGTKEIHYVQGGNGLCAIIVKENGGNNIYVPYTDYLGSILTVTDVNGNIVAEQNFDAWGRKRNPQDWTYNNIPTVVQTWLYRGFTGHEHLPQFALINMNGRLYDPIQGRMISPDVYVAGLFSTQGYNRYSYANNNPLSYVDPDGNFILSAIGNLISHAIRGDVRDIGDAFHYFGQGAVAGLFKGGLDVLPLINPLTWVSVVSGLGDGIFTGDWSRIDNAGRIFLGNYYIDENKSFWAGAWQGVSRHTWEIIQTTIGYTYTQTRNAVGNVDRVTFFGGATWAWRFDMPGDRWGVTMGSYVNMRIRDQNTNIISDGLYMHEYGHTIQSQYLGLLYPFLVMIPSPISAATADPLPGAPGLSTHDYRWYERGANRYAARYFGENFGVNWSTWEPPTSTYPRRRR